RGQKGGKVCACDESAKNCKVNCLKREWMREIIDGLMTRQHKSTMTTSRSFNCSEASRAEILGNANLSRLLPSTCCLLLDFSLLLSLNIADCSLFAESLIIMVHSVFTKLDDGAQYFTARAI